jgi:hypothetical protein
LQKNHARGGVEFLIPQVGPVTVAVAQRLLEHPLMHEVDPGLLPGLSQSWSMGRRR